MTDQGGAQFDPRAFLRSRAGGALTALAGVLLIVALLIAIGGEPADETPAAADGSVASQPTKPTKPTGTSGTTGTSSTPVEPSRAPTTAPSEPATTTAQPPPATTTAPPPTAEPPHVVRLPVSVLNNTTIQGLAGSVADEFRAGGWRVEFVGNFAGRIPVSTVYFTPGHDQERRAAEALANQFPAIRRVMPRYEGLPSGVRGVVVVVVKDWVDP